ncbi:cupin domain-containing protein [Candidatus Omnitrophota bacterium]
MFIRKLQDRGEFISGDGAALREFLNPAKEKLDLRYSLAHAKVEPGRKTKLHKLTVSEVYYIIGGKGVMYIDNESEEVSAGCMVYIPPDSKQCIENTGDRDLTFICIVDPAWKPEHEEVYKI